MIPFSEQAQITLIYNVKLNLLNRRSTVSGSSMHNMPWRPLSSSLWQKPATRILPQEIFLYSVIVILKSSNDHKITINNLKIKK